MTNTKCKVMMKTMIITARFKGQDGSLGYKNGKNYKLRLTHDNGDEISIQDTSKNPAGNCRYSNMLTFMQNWENVTDVTAQEPKRDPKTVVLNFIDFCVGKSKSQIESAHRFYKKPFDHKDVMRYFQNWSLSNTLKYRNGWVLTNINTELDCKVKIWINDNAEYVFCSGSDGTENPEKQKSWQYLPKTMSEFISDCLRYEDIELLFNKKAIKEIYGE